MRNRVLSILILVAVTVLCVSSVVAQDSPIPTGACLIGPGLGSTLLFPYFEVDLDHPDGVTTLISVNNSPNTFALTRLIMWTDWGVPTMAFDIYLGGIDIQTINVRSLFEGHLPATGVGVDLSAVEGCAADPPAYGSPALTPGQKEQLKTAHTGQSGHIDGLCHGADHGDGIARGFITVDVVDQCTGLEGQDPQITPANGCCGYFVDGGLPSGIAIVDNRLWGDLIYVDFANNAAQGSEAISLWADPVEFSGPHIYTFYGRHSGHSGRDERVPLPTTWDQRFLNGGAFDGGAELIVFQQPLSADATPVSCGTAPSWFPLITTVGTVDEEGDNMFFYDEDIFGLVTQKVSIEEIGPAYDFGWIHLLANSRQMWVQPVLSGHGRFSAGFNGTPIYFLCGLSPPTE